jgi:hypothetical protein
LPPTYSRANGTGFAYRGVVARSRKLTADDVALTGPKRCAASAKAGPRGGFADEDAPCAWYWPEDESLRRYHYCGLPKGHDGDHQCADGVRVPSVRSEQA